MISLKRAVLPFVIMYQEHLPFEAHQSVQQIQIVVCAHGEHGYAFNSLDYKLSRAQAMTAMTECKWWNELYACRMMVLTSHCGRPRAPERGMLRLL